MEITAINEKARQFEEAYKLRSQPIGVKFLEKAADAPKGTVFPMRDMKKHMALCQAFSYARMKGMTIGLTTEDHWCWNPLIGLGNVECVPGQEQFDEVVKYLGIRDKAKAETFFAHFPRLPLHKYEAIVLAPLKKAAFEPDVVMIYAEPAKVNSMVRSIKGVTGDYVRSIFDGIDSCVYCTVPSFLENEYRLTLPDPGERERARTRDEDVILTVPGKRLEEFFDCLNLGSPFGGFSDAMLDCELDFPRPPFYNKLFELWGLEKGEDWKLG